MKPNQPALYIQEYYELIKEKYPHLSHSQVDDICRTSFKLIRSEMQSGSLRTVRLMYLGSFKVNRGRAIGLLNKTHKMFKAEKVKKPTLDYITEIVSEYLKREYDEDLPPEKISET